MHAVTDETFNDVVLQSKTPVLVDFWAEWCGPCRAVAPVLEELSKEMGDQVTIAKLDIDSNPEIPTSLGIRSIPTLILFKDGKPHATQTGALPKGALKQWLEQNL